MPNKPNLDRNRHAPSIGTDLGLAARYLRQGLPVGMPTETVYGMAANALDAEAVARVFKAKKRPDFDPLIVHIGPNSPLREWVREIPTEAEALMAAFWPGPLTLLLPKTERIPDLVTSGLDRVGLRMPSHPMALALLDMLDFPLAAPSANLFGYISPTKARHVREAFGPELPYVLDGEIARLVWNRPLLDLKMEKLGCTAEGALKAPHWLRFWATFPKNASVPRNTRLLRACCQGITLPERPCLF